TFTDIIMLGTDKSSMFYLAVDLSDFTNELSNDTRLRTVLCLLDCNQDQLEVILGSEVYKGLFKYYRCSARDVIIPLSQIIGGMPTIDQGIRQMYVNQA